MWTFKSRAGKQRQPVLMEAPMLDSVTDLRSLLKDPSLLPNKAYVAG